MNIESSFMSQKCALNVIHIYTPFILELQVYSNVKMVHLRL